MNDINKDINKTTGVSECPPMDKYVRLNVVKAEPMTAWDFDKLKNREHSGENRKGYKVIYDDGYVSWCPKARFDEVSRPIANMTFGMALEAMRRGKKVMRMSWFSAIDRQYIFLGYEGIGYPVNFLDTATMKPNNARACMFLVKNLTDAPVANYVPITEEILADDWIIA